MGAPGAELDELRIEHIFPADPDSEALLRRLAQSPAPVGLTFPAREAPAMADLPLREGLLFRATDR